MTTGTAPEVRTPARAGHSRGSGYRARRGDGSPPVMWRRMVVVPAAVALLAGLDAGLMLLGVPSPVSADRLPRVHGMVLVFGFVGTLVSAERAVALGRRPAFLAPALLGLGGLLLVSPAPMTLGRAAMLAGAAALVGVYVPLWRRQRDDAVLVQALGAVLAVGALALWLGGLDVADLLPWLAGFVVLTIGGERLELARVAMGPHAGATLVLLSSAVAVTVATALLWPGVGYPAFGAVLLVLVGWLAFHDVARHTIRATGLTRFMAGCMLSGYGWLAVAAVTWLLAGQVTDTGPVGGGSGAVAGHAAGYDAVIHAVFLGFTISMVMAHAPVILPAVVRRPLPYHPVLVVPAVVLNVGLVVRIWVGDARGVQGAWQTGGVLDVVALLGFFTLAAWSALRGPRTPPPASRARAPRTAAGTGQGGAA